MYITNGICSITSTVVVSGPVPIDPYYIVSSSSAIPHHIHYSDTPYVINLFQKAISVFSLNYKLVRSRKYNERLSLCIMKGHILKQCESQLPLTIVPHTGTYTQCTYVHQSITLKHSNYCCKQHIKYYGLLGNITKAKFEIPDGMQI